MQRGQLSQKWRGRSRGRRLVDSWNVFNSIGLCCYTSTIAENQHRVWGEKSFVSGGNETLGVTTADVAGIHDGRKSYLYSISRTQVNIDASSY